MSHTVNNYSINIKTCSLTNYLLIKKNTIVHIHVIQVYIIMLISNDDLIGSWFWINSTTFSFIIYF